MIKAFPLSWPLGYPRTPARLREGGKFKTQFAGARDALLKEINRMGGSEPIISCDVPLRYDGIADGARKKEAIDPGVSVYFIYQKEQVVFACDKWYAVDDNLQAIRKAIEAFRGLERWGCSDLIKRSFQGMMALPESSSGAWWQVLGVSKTASKDEIKSAYRNLSSIHHPDAGGSSEKFNQLTEAYQQGLKQTL